MLIPVWVRNYTVTASAKSLKHARCEQCGCDYVYMMSRSAEGGGSSFYALDNEGAESRAAAGAERRAETAIQKGCDPVPCPECGWLQEGMVRELARRRYGWLLPVGVAVPIVGCLLSLAVWNRSGPEGLPVTLLCVGVVMVALRWILPAVRNPNADPAANLTRRAERFQHGMRRPDYEALPEVRAARELAEQSDEKAAAYRKRLLAGGRPKVNVD